MGGQENRTSTRSLADDSDTWSTAESSHGAQRLEKRKGDGASLGCALGALHGTDGLK